VLVGDPQQLPATVLSKKSKELAFDRSLFERLMQARWPVQMLKTQYRMHSQIRMFPSKHFYNNELLVRPAGH
jgi:senataxin